MILILIFFIDRTSKIYILNLADNEQFLNIYINKFLNIYLIWNTGIGFGLFTTTESFYYNVISSLIGIVILILIYIIFKSDKFDKLVFSLITGGALGNLYDRLVFKGVPDFIDLHYGNFHWFTFNVADIFITLGIVIYLLKGIVVK